MATVPPPTKLELQAALGARAESLRTALGHALPLTAAADLDDAGRRAVAAVIGPLADALRAMSRDPAKKQTLGALAGVDFVVGEFPELHLEGTKLIVTAPALATDAWTPAHFRIELELLF